MRASANKTEHILAFYVLGLLVDFSWPMTGFRAPKALSLFGYGLAIEIVQYFLPYRTFFIDGTPVLDIMPYTKRDRKSRIRTPRPSKTRRPAR